MAPVDRQPPLGEPHAGLHFPFCQTRTSRFDLFQPPDDGRHGCATLHAGYAAGTPVQRMNSSLTHTVGNYLITPMTRLTDTGEYAASVSIRRGMYDRVFRLIPRFRSAARAARYALAQGRQLALHGQLI